MMQDEAMLIAYFLTYYPIGRLWGTKIIIDGLDSDGNDVQETRPEWDEHGRCAVDVAAHRIYDAKK